MLPACCLRADRSLYICILCINDCSINVVDECLGDVRGEKERKIEVRISHGRRPPKAIVQSSCRCDDEHYGHHKKTYIQLEGGHTRHVVGVVLGDLRNNEESESETGGETR